jgi:hypothetical protein
VFQDGSGGRPTYSPQTTSATAGAQSSQRRVPNHWPPPGASSNRVPCLPDWQPHAIPEGGRGHGSQMLPRSGGGAGSRLAITPTGARSCNRSHRWLTGNGYLPCLAAWPPIVSPNRSRRPTEGEVRPTAAAATTARSFGYVAAERSRPTG